MIITDFAIRRPLVTIVAMLVLVGGGLFALFSLPRDEFPDVQLPFVSVAVPYPGAAPAQVEREVLRPVEQAVRGVAGVKRVYGTALDGYASVEVEFVFGTSTAVAAQDVKDAVAAIRTDLPREVEEPLVRRFAEGDAPVVTLVVTGHHSARALTRVADPTVVQALRAVPGVAQVTVVGGATPELAVALRPDALANARVGVSEVVQALQAQSLAAPVGRVNGPAGEQSLRFQGRLATPADFAALPLAARDGRQLRLGDVANVTEGVEEPRTAARLDGAPAVSVEVRKARGASTSDVSARVRARLEALRPTLPPGVRMAVIRDTGVRVNEAVGDVQKTLLEGAALTVLVVFVFLNSWRSTVITGLALPVSVLASFIAVKLFGFKLETMSLMGLSLAIGILVDDAIVVRENIVRHVEMGKDHTQAAHEGTAEIGGAVAATTFAIVCVFVPVGVMGGLAGQYFKPFALTIAASVLVSLFVSFSLDPMLSAVWPDPHLAEHEKPWVTRQLDRFNRWFDRQAHSYRRVVAWALDHPGAVGLVTVASLVAALALPALGVVQTGFMPADDTSELSIAVDAPAGSDLAYTLRRAEAAAAVARTIPEVRTTYTTVGDPATKAVTSATVYVKLAPRHQRRDDAQHLAARLRAALRQVPGADIAVSASGDPSAGARPLQLQVRGRDLAAVSMAAARVAAAVRAVPGAADVGLSTRGVQPVLDVKVQRALAASVGVTAAQIAEGLRAAFAGIKAGDWVDPSGETREVTVRLAPESRRVAADLERLPVILSGAAGAPAAGAPDALPLAQLTTVRPAVGPADLQHIDGDVAVTVRGNVEGRAFGAVSADVAARVAALRLPDGVRVVAGGDAEGQDEVFGSMGVALATAVLLMYVVLVLQFGSWLDPLAILVSLPLSLVGVMGALALTGNTINMMSLVGVILLMGIVAKNAILLVDYAKHLHERENLPVREALVEAGAVRLRPIVMTTFALVAGMVPVALGTGEGAQFRAPLGIAVIGGTITSTLLTLLVIPTVYEVLVAGRAAASRAFARRLGRAGSPGADASVGPGADHAAPASAASA